MSLFGKKEKDKPQRYSLKDKLFPVSKPWGYSPQHVEDAIKGYTKVIEQQKQAINELRLELSTEKNARAKVENEFRNLQLQMSLTQAPNLNDIQEEFIQDKFKQQFKQSDNKPHRKTNKNDLINSEMSEPAPKNYFKDSNYNETRSSDDIINELFTGTGDDNDDGSDSENESDPDSYRQQSLNNSSKTSLNKNENLQKDINGSNKNTFNSQQNLSSNNSQENNDDIQLHEKDQSDSEFYGRNDNRESEVTPSRERTIDNDEISNKDSDYDKTIENIDQIKDINQMEDVNQKDNIVSNNDNNNNNSANSNEDNQLQNENSQDNIVEQSIVDDSNAISQNNYNKSSQNPVFEYGEEKVQVQKNEPNKEVNDMPDNVKPRNIKLNIKSSSKFNNNSSNNRDISNSKNMSNNSNVNNNESKKSEKELEAERRKKMSSESFEDKFGY